MPTDLLDGAPLVRFDPHREISPFALFRMLADGRSPLLVDVRPEPGMRMLAGAEPLPGPDWSPPDDRDTVLFDDDGTLALEVLARFPEAERARALFGGLDLYEFALDPEIVGRETFLRRSG